MKNLPYKHCLNCGTELQGKYCHKCGQQVTSKTLKLKDFLIEYANNAFIWDSQCLRTLWNLIRRPGHLTVEYLNGKFVSQEHPLKLNMFLLFVFISLFLSGRIPLFFKRTMLSCAIFLFNALCLSHSTTSYGILSYSQSVSNIPRRKRASKSFSTAAVIDSSVIKSISYAS